MQVIERGGYSREEILDVLHAKHNSRNVRFKYLLLDKNELFKKELKSVQGGEVSMSAFSTIKRTAKFRVKENYVPEHVEQVEAVKSWTHTTQSDFQQWTLTNLITTSAGDIRFPTYSAIVPSWNFETNYDANDGNLDWSEWQANLSTLEKVTGITGSYAQQITRTAVGNVGIKTKTFPITNLVANEKIYLSFFYKGNGTMANELPLYTYLMMNDNVGNIGGNGSQGSYTATDVGGGWKRMDFEFTIPSTNAGKSGGVLIAHATSTMAGGSFVVDNVYLGRTQPVWVGTAISPAYDFSDTELDTVEAIIKNSKADWTSTVSPYNPASGATAPYVNCYLRFSEDNGATWSAWSLESDATTINDTVGASVRELLIQFKFEASRYDFTSTASTLSHLYLEVTYNRSVLMPETTEINYLQDRIQPVMEIQMRDGNWVSFPLGVFLLSTPTRHDEVSGVYREIEAYDGLVVLEDDKFTSRYFVAGGQKYTLAVQNILSQAGISKFNIEESTKTVGSAGIEFKMGTSKLEAVNFLLSAINYTPLWVDAEGYYTTSPYVSPADRATDYDYMDDELSVTYNQMEEELDLFAIPNVWVVTQSNPEKTPLVAKKTNNDDKSPTSTGNLGRYIVDFREVDDIADQATLNAYVERIAFESSQVFGKLKFRTALMPFHEYSDVIRIKYDALKIDDKFAETGWTMKLEAGGVMEHEVRKVVKV